MIYMIKTTRPVPGFVVSGFVVSGVGRFAKVLRIARPCSGETEQIQ